MVKVEYKHDIDQVVFTPFGDQGIITMLGLDDGGKQYYVKTAKDSQWYKEKELNVNVKD